MYMFDTDILSNLMRKSPSHELQARIGAVPVEEQFTSSITLGELVYGAHKRRSERLLKEAERVMAHLQILPFDADAATRYGEIRAELEADGTPIGEADTRIAAIALVRGLIVVTGNIKHFGRVRNLCVQEWL